MAGSIIIRRLLGAMIEWLTMTLFTAFSSGIVWLIWD